MTPQPIDLQPFCVWKTALNTSGRSHSKPMEGKEMKPTTEFRETESTIMTLWLLPTPPDNLTTAEREWFDWAESEAKEILTDPDWLRDNDDALTLAGQREDMRYRLEEQAVAVAETDATSAQLTGRLRVLKSLLAKLYAANYIGSNKCNQPTKLNTIMKTEYELRPDRL